MMIKKTLTILAVSCMMYSCATKTESNPFFTEFQTEYGVPSFDDGFDILILFFYTF